MTKIVYAMLFVFAITLMAVSLTGMASAISPVKPAMWLSFNGCSSNPDNSSALYAPGESVHINGQNFALGNYSYSITANSNKCGDIGNVVASGNYTITGANFCFNAYTVQEGDCGPYKVDFGGENKNYNVKEEIPVVPEFGPVVFGLTVAGSVVLFFVVRRK